MALDNRLYDHSVIEFWLGGQGGKEIGIYCIKFEWAGMLNAGHRITASFEDRSQNVLDEDTIMTLLKKAKTQDGIDVDVIIHQSSKKDKKRTEKRSFKVLTLDSSLIGGLTSTILELVCIDEASWRLNRGICEGQAYKGKISSVITQVVNKFAKGISAQVDETTDNAENLWYDMKLDPKTFITSLLEFSSSITKNKTPLVVQCQDQEFKCREWSTLKPTKTDGRKFNIAHRNADPKEITDTGEIQILSNTFLTPFSSRLYTGGISATTGLYVDPKNTLLKDDRQKFADDTNTDQKLMTSLSPNQSFTKSEDGDKSGATFIQPVPEHNDGDVGLKYQDYAVGRARDWYMKIINTTLRVKLTIEPGDTDFHDIYACGRDKILLEVITISKDMKPYFIDGPWLLYGFKHLWDIENWKTELFLSRIEHNATGTKI